jgi:hypothetical protein
MTPIRAGDVVRLGASASVQFAGRRELRMRVIRVHDWPTYDGWIWVHGYALDRHGRATQRRSVFVRATGVASVRPRRPGRPRNVPRINEGGHGRSTACGSERTEAAVKDLDQLGTDVASRSAREFAEAAMLTLNTNAIAVALHVADLPPDWRELTHQDLISTAITGIRKIGLTEVIRIEAETRHLEEILTRARNRPPAEVSQARKRYRQIWSSFRRQQQTVDAAYAIVHPGSYGPLLPSGRHGAAA